MSVERTLVTGSLRADCRNDWYSSPKPFGWLPFLLPNRKAPRELRESLLLRG